MDLEANPRFRAMIAVLALGVLAGSQGGCSIRKMALKETAALLDDGMVAVYRSPDPENARTGLPGNLLTVEVLLESDPESRPLLLSLAQGYGAYTYLFVEDEIDRADAAGDMEQVRLLERRGERLYLHARSFALRWLDKPAFTQALLSGTSEEFAAIAKAELSAEDVPGLFWLALAWSGRINLDQSNPARIGELPKAEVMLERSVALGADYFHGLPLLMSGVFYAARPEMYGGDLPRGRKLFEQGIKVSEGRFLLGKFLLGRYYAVQAQDQALFCRVMDEIVAQDLDALPEQRMMNTISRDWAERWMARSGGLFEAGACGAADEATGGEAEDDDGMLY